MDDIIVISPTIARVEEMKALLASAYEIRDLGELRDYLGIAIIRDRPTRTIYLNQHPYLIKILRKFHLDNCIPLAAPTASTSALHPSVTPATDEHRHLYQAMLGSILYATVWIRPDLSERCSRLGQFTHNPSVEHLSTLRNVLAYIQGTTYLGLRFQVPQLMQIEVHSFGFCDYSDSSYADNQVDCKSTSGYVFKICGGPISWKSRKQSITAASSTAAEYVALSLATKEGVWLRRLNLELGSDAADVQTITIYGDNMPAISLTVNLEHHFRTKHIDVPFHYIHEQIQNGTVNVKYISTKIMPADGLTKPLTGMNFRRFVDLLGLVSAPGSIRDHSG